jgi:hypothetical protein
MRATVCGSPFLAPGLSAAIALFLFTADAGAQSAAAAHAPAVLRVGTFNGKPGNFPTIQAAVNAARPGDWILIAPGDYHEHGSPIAGVLITTPGLHLRGMDRNGVVVDGTVPGASRCSADPGDQDFGAGLAGRNGVEVLKADGVTIDNLTVCNFIGDANGSNGNQIWWNGGDGSGVIGMGAYAGSYLTASSTFYQAGTPNVAQYGIFASNARGPGSISYSYASNMGDSGFYVGACGDCNTVLSFVHAQNNTQGYSGTNAGGHLVIEDSEWDHNQAGIVPSTLAGDDLPPPQDGACPDSPTRSCTLIQRNWVHDNNNPNTPANALAGTVPVGSGMVLTGGRNDTVQHNLVTHNGSWGILLTDYPDFTPNFGAGYCLGGYVQYTPPAPYDQLYPGQLPIPCYFPSFGNRVNGNIFANNGFFGNDTNGDLADAALPSAADNCFSGNIDASGTLSSAPMHLQKPSVAGACGRPWSPDTDQEFLLTAELGCDSLGPASGACAGLPGPLYPLPTQVQLIPIPPQITMPDPCAGVPANPWCRR